MKEQIPERIFQTVLLRPYSLEHPEANLRKLAARCTSSPDKPQEATKNVKRGNFLGTRFHVVSVHSVYMVSIYR
jgi:hypothetical protein